MLQCKTAHHVIICQFIHIACYSSNSTLCCFEFHSLNTGLLRSFVKHFRTNFKGLAALEGADSLFCFSLINLFIFLISDSNFAISLIIILHRCYNGIGTYAENHVSNYSVLGIGGNFSLIVNGIL